MGLICDVGNVMQGGPSKDPGRPGPSTPGAETVIAGRPTKERVAKVALPTVAAVLATNLTIRVVAVEQFQVPRAALPLAPLFMASLCATLGPALGCYMAFRRPDPHAMRKFLLPGAVLMLVGIGLEVARFKGDHGHWGALFVGTSQGLLATAVVIPVLIWRLLTRR